MQARSVLAHLWPAGRFVGDEFHVGSINGEKGESFKISLQRGRVGVGADFAGNERPGDLLDCWSFATRGRKARGKDFAEVCEEIEQWLGSPAKPRPKPTEAPERYDLGPVTGQWDYVDADGVVVFTVYRYDPPGKRKEFRQRPPMPSSGRPLYNIPGIAKAATVVLVEGEKSAEALIDKGIVATCTAGGSKVPAEKTDWSPLKGKRVVIWPDADQPGLEFAEMARGAVEAAGGTPIVMEPPADKPSGWDAADAIAEGIDPAELLRGLMDGPRKASGVRTLDLEAWRGGAFQGDPKPIEWLVDKTMPLGTAGLLVAMGDAGKGLLTLDLALKVAMPKPDGGLLEDAPQALGCAVTATGPAVILAAEDDRDELHRRLHNLDPDNRRKEAPIYTVPLPNAGGPLPIIKTSSTQGPYITPEWTALKSHLVGMKPKLVVFDPLASFIHADVNADPAAGAFATGTLAALATESGSTILVCHHMGKTRAPITTPEEARAAIRGSTAIVDGMRFAYALWVADEQEARRICNGLDEEWARNRVFKGCIVKSNAPVDRSIRTFLRDMETGLLVDRTQSILGNKTLKRDLELDELCLAIASAASDGFPFTLMGGSTGIYERRSELPEAFHSMGRDRVRRLVDDLMAAGRVVRVRHKGQTSPWLDAADGDFAGGFVELQTGARRR